MNDPVASISAPPPRYLLESDSSDEEGQGNYPYRQSGPSRSLLSSSKDPSASQVRIAWSSSMKNEKPSSLSEVILGVGQAGRYLARKFGKGKAPGRATKVVESDAKVSLGDEDVGQGWLLMKETMLLVLEDLEGEAAWSVAKHLVGQKKAEKWVVVTSYVPSMYILGEDTARSNRNPAIPRIRQLSSGSSRIGGSHLPSWESPNHLTGLPAAIFSIAAHPSSNLSPDHLTTLLLPLPLSGIDKADLVAALSAVSPGAGQVLESVQKQAGSEAKWSEEDDEPFSAPGMGGGRNRWLGQGTKLEKEEISSMYM